MTTNDISIKINDVIEEMKLVYKNDNRPWIIVVVKIVLLLFN